MNDIQKKEFKQFIKASRVETENCQKVTSNPITPVSHLPILKKINTEIERYKIPTDLLPNPEWSHNLVQWFGYIRHDISQIKKQNDLDSNNTVLADGAEGKQKKITFVDIVQSIERGDFPTADIITTVNDAAGILFYFKKRHSNFSHSDLCWIFGALARIDRLMNPDMCECVQIISSIVKKQICEGGDKNNQLYPYLSVINDLIVKYFHQF